MCKARAKLNNCVRLGNIHVESLIYWVLSNSYWVKQASLYIFYLISKQLYWIQIHAISETTCLCPYLQFTNKVKVNAKKVNIIAFSQMHGTVFPRVLIR